MTMTSASRSLFLLLLLLSAACRSSVPPSQPAAPAVSAPAAAAAKADPDSVKWVRESAEFRALFVQVYRLATVHVEAAARTRAAGTWAVVLDADETLIDNSLHELERERQGGLPFTPEGWDAWVKRREATPLPGAAAFLSRVRALGGRIAIVTNRLQSQCADTAAVFEKHALVYDAMLCRPNGSPSDKNPRFEAVAAGKSPASASPLDVVAFVGDNIQDFPNLTQTVRAGGEAAFAEFGVRYFVLPNPMYGSWERP
jgi:5'-nucleotidase (lipoprotein e(P4) family)